MTSRSLMSLGFVGGFGVMPPRRCETVKPWMRCETLGFYVGSLNRRVILVLVVSRLVLKIHPWYGNFSNFEVNRSGAKLSSWIQSLGVMNDWMTERVAKTRVKEEEEVLVSFCRSPEMSQHLAVLLVSFLKVGWSFWTTYNASKQIYRKLSTRRRWRKRSLRPWNCLLDGDLHLEFFRTSTWHWPSRPSRLAGGHETWRISNEGPYNDAAENFSPFCFQEETCTCC